MLLSERLLCPAGLGWMSPPLVVSHPRIGRSRPCIQRPVSTATRTTSSETAPTARRLSERRRRRTGGQPASPLDRDTALRATSIPRHWSRWSVPPYARTDWGIENQRGPPADRGRRSRQGWSPTGVPLTRVALARTILAVARMGHPCRHRSETLDRVVRAAADGLPAMGFRLKTGRSCTRWTELAEPLSRPRPEPSSAELTRNAGYEAPTRVPSGPPRNRQG